MKRIISKPSLLFIMIFILITKIHAAGVNIEGYVKDVTTGDPLIGTNVVLIGTSKGATTNTDGKYIIRNVAPGSYTIRASYIGYYDVKAEIIVTEKENLQKNFSLEPVSIQGAEVVITGQAYGQKQAINQQLSADQILNAVSAEKIQELPDANAAESIGRLPGIAVLRSGGEGDEVVVRGLAPKYNTITIDGVQMSNSNPYDRSADLSMISSNMLEGIQISKTVTADMDAEVLGGSVNFEVREAKDNQLGRPLLSFLSQGGYNNLANAYNKYNNYKYVASVEERFYNNSFGVFAQVDVERKNLTSNELGASYTNDIYNPSSFTDYLSTGLTLSDVPRDRQRINGALVVDYAYPDGKIKLTNFLSSGNTDIRNRQQFFNIANLQNNYSLSYSYSKLSTLSNSLDYKQTFPFFNLHAKLSHTYSETNDPNDWSVNFMQKDATGLNQFTKMKNPDPKDIQKGATLNKAITYLRSIQTTDSFSKERALTASLDLDQDFNITDFITTNVKLGGKFRHQTRSYDFNLMGAGGGSFVDISAAPITSLISKNFGVIVGTNPNELPMTSFIDPGYDYGKFMGGDYQMGAPLDFAKLSEMVSLVKQYAYLNVPAYTTDDFNSKAFDYSGYEDKSAFYLMSTVKIGPDIILIPGIRYQNLKTSYNAAQGQVNTAASVLYPHMDTTVIKNYSFWLPSISLKYKPFSWCDIRLAYSKTLAYPGYFEIIPSIIVNGTSINYTNNQLVPSLSTNYDVYLSFYENTIGLFTAGAFLKRIDDLIFSTSIHASGNDVLKYGPPSRIWRPSNPNQVYFINTYINSPYRIDDYGMELDWQTHFWYLPGPLSGLVFNANYTHIFSKATYPYLNQVRAGRTITYIDTAYTDRLLDQPDDILNLSLGFDYSGFSARLSMLYQTNIFTGTNFWPQIRTNTAAYRRWDLAVKQDLPWFGIQLYGDLNNINGANDISVIQGGAGIPQSQQDYGMTADLGIRLKF